MLVWVNLRLEGNFNLETIRKKYIHLLPALQPPPPTLIHHTSFLPLVRSLLFHLNFLSLRSEHGVSNKTEAILKTTERLNFLALARARVCRTFERFVKE